MEDEAALLLAERSMKAYKTIPLARVFVETLAQACDLPVADGMIKAVLGGRVLLDMLDAAQERTARLQRESIVAP